MTNFELKKKFAIARILVLNLILNAYCDGKMFIHDEFLSRNCDCRSVHDNKFQNFDCINAQDKSKCNTHGEKKWASQLVLIDYIFYSTI